MFFFFIPTLRHLIQRRCGRWIHICVVLILLASSSLFAQTTKLFLDHIDISRFPEIQIALHVDDNSIRVTDLTPQNFIVKENGIIQSPITLDCTEDSSRPPVSFMMLLDKSFSMVLKEDDPRQIDPDSLKFRAARQVFKDFIHNMRPVDEASLISFSASPSTEQVFTSDTSDLLDAIYGVKVSPGTAIFDAIIKGIALVSPRTGRKVIILITDGNDVSSVNDFTVAIKAAQLAGIPVYCIGLGNDVNAAQLQAIADQTGGEYFFAPTANELATMYNRIASSIFSGVCELRYTSNAMCPDGALRNVEVTYTRNASSATKVVGYFAPYLPDSVWLAFDPIPVIPNDTEFMIPVYYTGTIDSAEALSFRIEYRFDPNVLDFIRIETTGTMTEGASIQTQVTGNLLTIELTNFNARFAITRGNRSVFFNCRFFAKPKKQIIRTALELVNHTLKKRCDAFTLGSDAQITIDGCPTHLRLAIDSTIIIRAGQECLIPIRLIDAVDKLQVLRYAIQFAIDTSVLQFLGVVQEKTVASKHTITAVTMGTGEFEIRSSDAFPSDSIGDLVYLRFAVASFKESVVSHLRIRSARIEQGCVPLVSFNSAVLLVDGLCEPLILKKRIFALHQNTPNPANPSTTIRYSVRGGSPVKLELFTSHGVKVQTLVERTLDAGWYAVSFDTSPLPSGLYFYRLTEGNQSLTKKLLLMK